jgi:hypothetical protein
MKGAHPLPKRANLENPPYSPPMSHRTFRDFYYGAAISSAPAEPQKPDVRGFLEELLRTTDPDLFSRVEKSVSTWNRPIRDHLRSETGLKISTTVRRSSVPIKILAAIPEPLLGLMLQYWDPSLWRLYFLRGRLVEALQGIELVLDHKEDVRRLLEMSDDRRFDHLFISKQLLEGILDALNVEELLKRLLPIDQDVLGAYFFRIPEIQLYWIPIGFIAGMLGLRVEALTAVVLGHELAHAYTHLGLDIDDQDWDTNSFAGTELEIAEGLAQFYTRGVGIKLEQRAPEILKAFDAFLGVQQGPYLVHNSWGEASSQLGEQIRMTMLQVRTKKLVSYSDFLERLEWAKESLPR